MNDRFRKALFLLMACATFVLASALPASATTDRLRSTIAIPASCKTTAVYGSDLPGGAPWIDAQPRFERIVMVLSERVGHDFTYTPVRAGGADVLLRGPASYISIKGWSNDRGRAGFSSILPSNGSYQRLRLPEPGCWHLRLQSGVHTAWITLWARPRASR